MKDVLNGGEDSFLAWYLRNSNGVSRNCFTALKIPLTNA
jgi:hypothetical protein